ncbi:sensor histidine kinase [Nonomuraea ceibae]|uniref:sensor histidine kinase n=1 Tax=Nonomuraea ceibae TaxID=1935170 RepID=UPI001C5D2480|nr:histidine kinase [Nonomuraea ceibae]
MALSPARLLVPFVILSCLVRVTFHLEETGAGPLTLASLVGVAALQLPISLPGRRRPWAALLPAQAVLNYLPLLAEADSWRAGGSGFVACSVLLVVGGPVAWAVFGLVAVVEGAIAVTLGLPAVYVYYAIVAPLNAGLMLYGFSHLARLLDQVERERSELAAKAAEVERLRLWGHVHGLVMSSVSAVERLARLRGDTAATRNAISQAVAVARGALQQLRSLPRTEEPVPPRDDDRRILRLATPILVIAHSLFIGQSVFNFVADELADAGSGQAGYLALLPVTFALQFWHLAALHAGGRPRRWRWTLAAQALTIYAPLVHGESSGIMVSGYFVGVILLYVRAAVSWPLCLLVCGVAAVEGWPVVSPYQFCSALATALAVYGLTRLVALVNELRRTRAELVEVAILRERLRVGRDVHDLLGRGLTTVVLHGELALRLLDAEPERAAEQVGRVSEAARAARADAARLSTPDRRLSLADEIDSARAVLESVGATVRIEAAPVPERAGPVLAVVLREAVTNVLRHSAPRECLIAIVAEDGHARLRVTNDGVGPVLDQGGSGLRGLRARLADVGGELTTSRTGDRFDLLARAPVDHEDLTATR